MKRPVLIALVLVAALTVFALPAPPAAAYDSLPPGMPEGWETAPLQIKCDLEVNGSKVFHHAYRSFAAGAEPTFPAWSVRIWGRDGESREVETNSMASADADLETQTFARPANTEWQSSSRFSPEELDALDACDSEKYSELKAQYLKEHPPAPKEPAGDPSPNQQ